MSKRPNPRLAKLHRNYTVEEIAGLYRIHKGTVRIWIKQGLPVTEKRRPLLITGSDLRDFLQAKRNKNRRKCAPGELYCFRCRAPRKPAGDMADFQPVTAKLGKLTAICPVCECLMYQRIGMAKLAQIRTQLDITFTQAQQRLGDSRQPIVNSDLSEVPKP